MSNDPKPNPGIQFINGALIIDPSIIGLSQDILKRQARSIVVGKTEDFAFLSGGGFLVNSGSLLPIFTNLGAE